MTRRQREGVTDRHQGGRQGNPVMPWFPTWRIMTGEWKNSLFSSRPGDLRPLSDERAPQPCPLLLSCPNCPPRGI